MSWSNEEWTEFSLAVEKASAGLWRRDTSPCNGILGLHPPDAPTDDPVAYSHPQFTGDSIRTPYATKSGNTATTMVPSTLTEAADRWVRFPGVVISERVKAANAERAAETANNNARSTMAHDLITFLHVHADPVHGVVWGNYSVSVSVGHATMDVRMMRDLIPMITDAHGPAGDVMLAASAVDRWQAYRLTDEHRTDEHRKATP